MYAKFKDKILLPLIWTTGSFFAARCMLLDELCPIGIAYLVQLMSKRYFAAALIVSALGLFTRINEVYIWGYIAGLVLMGIIYTLTAVFGLSLTDKGKALVAAVCSIAGDLFGAILQGLTAHLVIIAVLEGLLSFFLSTVFCEGIYAQRAGGGKEIYGFSLLVGCVLGGMSDIKPVGLSLCIPVTSLLLPKICRKQLLTSADGSHLRAYAVGKLEGFARSLERLSHSLSNVTDNITDDVSSDMLKKSLKTSRTLLSTELDEVCALLRGLSDELTGELAPNSRLGREIKERLQSGGLSCEQALVYKDDVNIYSVNIIRKCKGSCNKCIRRARAAAEDVLGCKLEQSDSFCMGDGKRHTLSLSSRRTFRISAYAAAKVRDGSEVSGDSHTFMELRCGKYMLALSDGMGSGGRAKEESAASVELFEDFMEAGFNRESALNQINSLLLMKAGNDDIFATLDICNVDLYSGMAEFVKIGGMPCFISSSDGVRLIGGGGLPVGIMDKAEAQSACVQLKSGDLIVMITDGVADALPCVIGKEGKLAKIIDENRSLSPERLCNKLLDTAVAAANGAVRDDMTVIAARVWKA